MNKFYNFMSNKYLSLNVFIQMFFNMVFLVFIMYFCWILMNMLNEELGREYFGLLFFLILSLLVFTDKRMELKNKLMFLFMMVMQMMLYIYCDIMYLDFLKDMFWFSLTLNMGFMWHTLMLNSMYLYISKSSGNFEMMKFMMSSLSYMSSLSMVIMVLRNIGFLLSLMDIYLESTILVFPEAWSYKYKLLFWLNKKSMLIYLTCMLSIMECVFLFFMKAFTNYSLLLMGKSPMNMKWNKALLLYMFMFMMMFGFSMYFGMPSMYMVWLFVLFINYMEFMELKDNVFFMKKPLNADIYNDSRIVSKMVKLKWYQMFYHMEVWGSFLESWYFDYYSNNYNNYMFKMLKDWEILYGKEFFADLIFYMERFCFCNGGDSEILAFQLQFLNIYDMLKIFWYNKTSYTESFYLIMSYYELMNMQPRFLNSTNEQHHMLMYALLVRMSYTDEYLIKFKKRMIEHFYLNMTMEEFDKLLVEYSTLNIYPLMWVDEWEPMSLWKFLFGLISGTYVVSTTRRVSNSPMHAISFKKNKFPPYDE